MPTLNGVIETALYVDDLQRSIGFYAAVFGLEPMVRDARFCAFDVGGQCVLLLFQKPGSITALRTPGGSIPPHEGSGRLHLAFAVAAAELGSWEFTLASHGVAVESRVTWPRGGISLYLRDPDAHLIELVTPGLWRIY